MTEQNFLTRSELELKNMIMIAALVVEAALTRKGSAGAHYRSDYKDRGEGWQSHRRWDKDSFEFFLPEPAPAGKTACP